MSLISGPWQSVPTQTPTSWCAGGAAAQSAAAAVDVFEVPPQVFGLPSVTRIVIDALAAAPRPSSASCCIERSRPHAVEVVPAIWLMLPMHVASCFESVVI